MDGEQEMICTSRTECPDFSDSGWKFLGSWSKEKCEDCPGEWVELLEPNIDFEIYKNLRLFFLMQYSKSFY